MYVKIMKSRGIIEDILCCDVRKKGKEVDGRKRVEQRGRILFTFRRCQVRWYLAVHVTNLTKQGRFHMTNSY